MKSSKYILLFAWRLLSREWPKYLLAFLSLFVTGVTFTVVLSGVDGARQYLGERSREFVGGDIAFESGVPIDIERVVKPLEPYIERFDRETELNLSVRTERGVTGVSARAITENFPLYGQVETAPEAYRFPQPDEVYVEAVALERLKLSVGERLSIGETLYTVIGTIEREPDALIQGFRFAPRLFLSQAGLERSGVVLVESRNEYEYRYRFQAMPPESLLASVKAQALAQGLEVRIAGDGQSGFLRRLANVERFFLVTVLIGAVLSAVNVYANTLSLIGRLRKSFAVFLVEGATQRSLVALVLGIIGSITLVATLIGTGVGMLILAWVEGWVARTAEVAIVFSLTPITFGLVILATLLTSLAAAFPAVSDLLSLEPRSLLSGSWTEGRQRSGWLLVGMSSLSFLPLFLLTFSLLKRLWLTVLVVGGTLVTFLIIASLVTLLLRAVYRVRRRLSFFFRVIIAEKFSDGVFGIVAATSLTIALTSIFSLSLLERSLERFFQTGIGATIPSAYVIDVQPDQQATVQALLPGVSLFPNVRARILRIDDRAIQERLEADAESEDRELRREFNLTYRTEFLESERVIAGAWQGNRRGEVSVEREFAERAGIRLGSQIEFFIQGVRLSLVVTSLREAETTSGLPFFYFVLHPDDVSRFPGSAFGYADVTPEVLRQAEAALARETPNVTVLDTTAIGETVQQVTATTLSLLRVVTLPPLLLSILLLVTLVAATFAHRRRDGLRLEVLGARPSLTIRLYLTEIGLTVVVVGALSFLLSTLLVFLVTTWVLEAVPPVYTDMRLLEITVTLLFLLTGYAASLLFFGRQTLRAALAYEENT